MTAEVFEVLFVGGCHRPGAGRLLTDMVSTLRREIDDLQPAAAAAVAAGVVDVLSASLHSLPACCQPALHAHHVARILQHIDVHLRDPSLTVESVAAGLGMSVGHLLRVFQAEAVSPSHYIWTSRLDACSRELLDPRCERAIIAAIAFAWGFNNTAHFSRAFRSRFQASPSECRRQGARAKP